MILLLLLLPPLVAVVLASIVRPYRAGVGWAGVVSSLVSLGAALGIATVVCSGDAATVFGPGDFLRADALSALATVCVAAAASLVLAAGPGLGRDRQYTREQLRRYHIVINLLVFTMYFAVTANSVGFMWVAIEATTIASAVLIPLTLTKSSVEASWKYIIVSSVGIAIAFLGTVLAYFNFTAFVGHAENALNWPTLVASAPLLKPEVMRLAFALLLVGYGTKAGLAPMHTWKPDAYGEAPAAHAALMSSALFVVAMYAIARWKVVVDTTTHDQFADSLLLTIGILSVGVAAFSVVIQRNFKRMLAYSSVEHAGLVCMGLALGPLGVFAALLHLVNHTAVKSFMFLVAGTIERAYGSSRIDDVRGLNKRLPWSGGLFSVGLLALVGAPPFGIFMSEFALFRAGFAAEHYWLMGCTLVLLAIAFVALIAHLNRMVYGEASGVGRSGDLGAWRLVPLLLAVAVFVTTGAALPEPLVMLLNKAVEVLRA